MIKFKKILYILNILLSISSLSFATFNNSASLEETAFTHSLKSAVQIIGETEVYTPSSGNLKASKTALPTSVDLSMFADILDQGNLGSCTSHCILQGLKVMETIELMQNDPSLTLKEAKAKIPRLS